jgi:hypothetical protein
MEHREPLRIGAGDRPLEAVAPQPAGRFRVCRIESISSARFRNPRHCVLRALALTAGLALAVWFLAKSLVGWLQVQESYQVPFRSIRLDSELPPWYRGGTADFLERVRQDAGEEDILPVLRRKPEDIQRAFGHHPLVDHVSRVIYPPRGIRVALRFCQPVALVEVSAAERYLLDEKATILPLEEVNLARLEGLGPLIRIEGQGLAGPLHPRPGATWKPTMGVVDLNEGNARIPAAAHLAGFLVQKIRALGPARAPALEIRVIIPTDHPENGKNRGLFLWNREKTCILWGEPLGQESPGSLTAEQKWAELCDWNQRTKQRTLEPGRFWAFNRKGRLQPAGPVPRVQPHPSTHF